MVNSLVGVHAVLGELGIAAFLWVFVEMLKPTPSRLSRAKIAAFLGVVFFFASWIIGGYYYSNIYGTVVKPIIKEGPQPWAHLVFMEAKEHIFLFLPFLAIFAYTMIIRFQSHLKDDKDPNARKAILAISSLILILGALMAFMGYMISSGYRAALEALP